MKSAFAAAFVALLVPAVAFADGNDRFFSIGGLLQTVGQMTDSSSSADNIAIVSASSDDTDIDIETDVNGVRNSQVIHSSGGTDIDVATSSVNDGAVSETRIIVHTTGTTADTANSSAGLRVVHVPVGNTSMVVVGTSSAPRMRAVLPWLPHFFTAWLAWFGI